MNIDFIKIGMMMAIKTLTPEENLILLLHHRHHNSFKTLATFFEYDDHYTLSIYRSAIKKIKDYVGKDNFERVDLLTFLYQYADLVDAFPTYTTTSNVCHGMRG
jgi:hypothetical protein